MALGLYFNHAELPSHLHELDTTKSFCQDVGELIDSTHVLNVNHAVLNTFTNKMIPRVDVFAAVVVHWILAQRDRRLVIHHQLDPLRLRARQVTE